MTFGGLTSRAERGRLIDKLLEIDRVFSLALILIAGAGALMMFSIAGASWEPWAANHITRFGVAFVLMVALAVIDLRVWAAVAYPLYALGLILLIAVEVVGDVRMGAQRWLDLGPLGSFQPSEIMKLGLVLALGRFYHGLSADRARLSWYLLIPVAIIAAPTLLVAHQPDLGTAMLLALTGLAVVVLAGLSWRVIFAGSGGLMGKGYGLGSQSQLNFLPEKQTDFIFATLAEEFGFLGCMAVLLLYCAVIFTSLRTASVAHSHFGRLTAAGVTSTFALYVLINGAMVMGMAPVVGVPMPLLSYGGSVMLTVMIGFGLVQAVRVHRYDEVTGSKSSLI